MKIGFSNGCKSGKELISMFNLDASNIENLDDYNYVILPDDFSFTMENSTILYNHDEDTFEFVDSEGKVFDLLEDAKLEKRAELNQRCEEEIVKPILYKDHSFKMTRDDQLNLSLVKDLIEMTGQTQPYDGVLFVMEEVKELALLFGAQFYEAWNKNQELKSILDSSDTDTFEKVQAITWE